MLITQSLTPAVSAPSRDDLAHDLTLAAQSRRAQLAALPRDTSLVDVAHRASVTRILDSILAAQERLATGTFGACSHCFDRIDDRSLKCRPWTDLCDRCIRR